MYIFISFILGLLLGYGISYYGLRMIREALESLENKHDRLISILSEWQKKI